MAGTDAEDGPVDCSRVEVTFVLVHDTHGHAEENVTGCSGVLHSVAEDASHGGYIAGGISVTYTDDGANGQPPLSTTVQHLVQTHRQEVENVGRQEGTVAGTSYLPTQSPFREGLSAGDWMALNNRYDIGSATSVTASVNACGTEVGVPVGALEVRADAPEGPLLATLPVEVNDTFQYCQFVPTFTTVTASIDLDGAHEVYLVPVAVDGGPTEDYFRLDWVQFNEAP